MIDDTQVDGAVDGEETPVVSTEDETTEQAPEEAPATEAGEEEAA